jgi:hypothetical protein
MSAGDELLILFDPEAMQKGLNLIAALMGATMDAIKLIAMGIAPTKRIASAIETTKPATISGQFVADVHVDLIKAPEGAAFELGSGVHGLKQHTYPILPKNSGGELRFFWPNEDLSRGHPHTHDGKVRLHIVNHPGIVARQYLKPAFDARTGPDFIAAMDRIMHEVMHTGEDVNVDSKVFFL